MLDTGRESNLQLPLQRCAVLPLHYPAALVVKFTVESLKLISILEAFGNSASIHQIPIFLVKDQEERQVPGWEELERSSNKKICAKLDMWIVHCRIREQLKEEDSF